jgi:hypothetical protein
MPEPFHWLSFPAGVEFDGGFIHRVEESTIPEIISPTTQQR